MREIPDEKNRKTVSFYIKQKDEDKIYEIIENDVYIKNFAHFIEIAIEEYLKIYEKKSMVVDENE
ncbi:hypothetical protein LI142_22635 [Eubacterium limosum]|uniref:hypothetical protein n=1 Tax=Eubacterium limosum TaxID=1736 RepID=UPI001D06C7C8|nr:hypothetical protein [Eubacterium limosum]MCB6572295.1 hypothetical protein [Eubacterium limosum]